MKKSVKYFLTILTIMISIQIFAQDIGDNQEDITDVGRDFWNTFEKNVGESLTQNNTFYHVTLEIGGTIIVADYLLFNKATNLSKIIEVKASKIVDLDNGVYNLRNRCTANQKIIFDILKIGVTTAKIKVSKSPQDGNIKAALEPSIPIKLEKGVIFYVTSPKGQKVTFKQCDNCVNYIIPKQ